MKRTKKNKIKYVINFLKRVKWLNILELILFIISILILINDIKMLILGAAFTWYGVLTFTINLLLFEYIIVDLEEYFNNDLTEQLNK